MINPEDFAGRLQTLMDHFALSASAFADRIGVQRSGISHILTGRNKPSLDFVLKIIREFKTVDLYWLLLGTGSFPAGAAAASKSTAGPPPDPVKKSVQQHVPEKTDISTTVEKNDGIAKIIILYKNGNFDSFEN